jgi:ATP-dependent DNA helicase DinG
MNVNRHTVHFFPIPNAVFFDCETTGLDPEHDAILEVGLVRWNSDGTESRYFQLFDPQIAIPRTITLLTGIRPEDCEGQPFIHEKIQEIMRFMKGFWVIGHHVDFDLDFLRTACGRHCSDQDFIDSSRVLDTLELSRLLYPFFPNHRLDTVAGLLDVPVTRQHRALADAETTALIFRKMLSALLGLDPSVVSTVRRILDGASDGLRFLFDALGVQLKNSPTSKNVKHPDSKNVLGERTAAPDSEETEVQKVDLKEVERFFENDGALSQTLSKFELRKPQKDMAFSVAKVLNQDGFLVAEAGTGVGKSLSYLIPAALWAIGNPSDKTVISTHTKTLQDQLFFKDLPLVQQAVRKPFSAVLLKGRANYLCLARLQNLFDHLEEKLSQDQRRKLLPLVLWASRTQTGDIEENAGFQREANESVWTLVNSESSWCTGGQCPFESACFVQRIHRASRTANLLIVNHALLFSSLALNHSALGDFETLIIDEAHQIEKVASQHLGIVLHQGLFTEIVYWLHVQKPKEIGLLVALRHLVEHAASDPLPKFDSSVLRRIQDATRELSEASHQFFKGLSTLPIFSVADQSRANRTRVRIRESFVPQMPAAFERLERVLEQLRFNLSECLHQLKLGSFDVHPEGEPVCRELEIVADKLSVLVDGLVHFRKADFSKHAVWCEFVEKDQKREPFLHSVPIDIAGLLADMLYPKLRRGVLTSATLTVCERFDYLLHRWGLDCVEPERLTTKVFGSPYNFQDQALLLIPTFLSNPKENRFSSDLALLLQRLLTIHPRGTMVLFTSHSLLQETYDAVRPALEEKGIRLLGQGIDGSRTLLLKTFQKDVRSVLFGTSSFWEGVDVPGQALELLVITKIPFDVPTDPLIEARMERIHSQTGNGFLNYAVPEAVVKLRQGFGRLIRSTEDRGAVLMLDQRMTQKDYGSIFLKSLPVEARLCKDESSLFSLLNEWFTVN